MIGLDIRSSFSKIAINADDQSQVKIPNYSFTVTNTHIQEDLTTIFEHALINPQQDQT